MHGGRRPLVAPPHRAHEVEQQLADRLTLSQAENHTDHTGTGIPGIGLHQCTKIGQKVGLKDLCALDDDRLTTSSTIWE